MRQAVSFADISRATERAARALGLEDEEAQAAIELALEIVAVPNDRLPGLTIPQTRLVRLLKAAGGKVVPRAIVAAHVAPEAQEKIIDVYVANVRKLPDYGPHIVTVWGVGFAWRDGGGA